MPSYCTIVHHGSNIPISYNEMDEKEKYNWAFIHKEDGSISRTQLWIPISRKAIYRAPRESEWYRPFKHLNIEVAPIMRAEIETEYVFFEGSLGVWCRNVE